MPLLIEESYHGKMQRKLIPVALMRDRENMPKRFAHLKMFYAFLLFVLFAFSLYQLIISWPYHID